MQSLTLLVIGLCTVSIAACGLLCREFVHTSRKREDLLQLFHADMRSTKRSKHVLISVYVALTALISLGLGGLLLFSV